MKKYLMILFVILVSFSAIASFQLKLDVAPAFELNTNSIIKYRGFDVSLAGRYNISDEFRVGAKTDIVISKDHSACLAFATAGYVFNVNEIDLGLDLGIGFSKAIKGSFASKPALFAIDLALEGSYKLTDTMIVDFGFDVLAAFTNNNYGGACKPYIGMTFNF